jgi:hypothetical protein
VFIKEPPNAAIQDKITGSEGHGVRRNYLSIPALENYIGGVQTAPSRFPASVAKLQAGYGFRLSDIQRPAGRPGERSAVVSS